MLADLKGAQANLATTIGVLRSLTIGRVPDRGDYAAAGWRINQAS